MKISPKAAFSTLTGASNLTRLSGFLVGMAAVVTAGAAAPATKDTTERHVDDKTVEWRTLGGDLAHTRYAPLKQITPENFATLKPVWTWDGASFKAASGRSTPSYMNGKLFTVAGDHRSVIAIDPATGETIWSYREPGPLKQPDPRYLVQGCQPERERRNQLQP